MRTLKRYDLITNYRCGSSIEEMERNDEDGDWVRFEDVAPLLASETGAAAPSAQELARQAVEQFAAGWDESGLTAIREPYRWESVARACLDVLRAIASLSPSAQQEPTK